jgi:hypothetical protein
MPRFFFDLFLGKYVVLDPGGMMLSDRLRAISAAGDWPTIFSCRGPISTAAGAGFASATIAARRSVALKSIGSLLSNPQNETALAEATRPGSRYRRRDASGYTRDAPSFDRRTLP